MSQRRRAVVLMSLAAALWWHEWMPALLVVAFVAWVVLHKRFEDERGEGPLRVWRRVWPPATLVLVALIVAGVAVYGVSNRPIEAKVLPIALNAVALAILVVGRTRAVAVRVPTLAPNE